MRVRVWDWPTRLFHWLVVALIPLLWWSAKNDRMEQHMLLGSVMLALVLFRLIWGLIGSSTARFANFVKGPGAVISYLSGRAARALGHNPLGGWSVVAMLALLSAQVTLGLFASDEDGIDSGPLSHLIDGDLSEQFAELHEQLFDVLLVLIGLHVAAILFYAAIRRRNLVASMLTGSTEAQEGVAPMRPAPMWRLAAAVVAAAGAAWWIHSGI